jgi:Ca2+-binding EF-hand superfamily protein
MISYSDFLAAAADKKQLLSKENLRNTFRFFDVDRNGVVTKEEMKKVLNASGRHSDDDIWQEFLDQIDSDQNDIITFDEFLAFMQDIIDKMKSPSLTKHRSVENQYKNTPMLEQIKLTKGVSVMPFSLGMGPL